MVADTLLEAGGALFFRFLGGGAGGGRGGSILGNTPPMLVGKPKGGAPAKCWIVDLMDRGCKPVTCPPVGGSLRRND